MNNKKDPTLKIRYARGFGDFLACIIHSKPIGWFVHLITGNNKPCEICSQRAEALNILIPIPFWKLFFKNEVEMVKRMAEDLKDAGYEVKINEDDKGFSSFKAEEKILDPKIENFDTKENKKDGKYTLVTSGENFIGDFMIKTEIFQRK